MVGDSVLADSRILRLLTVTLPVKLLVPLGGSGITWSSESSGMDGSTGSSTGGTGTTSGGVSVPTSTV